ncbi:hypothetical protein K461DRAFT_269359 [Myriangium duriaei CBS 260.36]|uniref:Chitin-binding type-1 domain-containing protein n=1 Tax=Myriangium duriaei CBS 260.36 TaxID=1168546 RepID=A0A9P4IYM1_9PEZI|nr:hypothetical protein K461DRAFT_269359 [Myriangium duriaei CBS 260.36]
MTTILRSSLVWASLSLVLFVVPPATAQNAWYCVATPLQPATPVQCPTWAEISCSSIGASGFCCPSGTYCGWANGQVGCCTNGQSCSGQIAGGGQWQPSSTTTTTWYQPPPPPPQPTPCVVCAGQQTTVYVQPSTVTVQPSTVTVQPGYIPGKQTTTVINGFCSTQTAHGPGLPTTARGGCGTILVVASAPRVAIGQGMTTLGVGFVAIMLAILLS